MTNPDDEVGNVAKSLVEILYHRAFAIEKAAKLLSQKTKLSLHSVFVVKFSPIITNLASRPPG